MNPYNLDTFNRQVQRHTHEYLGSDSFVGSHNHRFAGITSGSIMLPNGNHYHTLETNTDYFENHFHIISGKTGIGIPVSENKHIHFMEGEGTLQDRHKHNYKFATLI